MEPLSRIHVPMKQPEDRAFQQQLQVGAICPHCYREDCPRDVKTRAIMMREKKGYPVECCSNKAKELQQGEDLRRQGIRADLIAGLQRLSGIPDKFSEADFVGFEIDLQNGEAVSAALELVNEFKQREKIARGLVMVGSTGVGKTHLGVAILRRLIQQGVGCRYVYAESFLDLARRRPLDQSDLGHQTLRAFCTERLIFLDDVGIGKDSEFTVAQYTTLLDARYREKRPIVLASNLGLEDLATVIGERSMSRLIETNEIVEIGGKDWRLER